MKSRIWTMTALKRLQKSKIFCNSQNTKHKCFRCVCIWLYLSTIRSKVRLRRQSVRPFSASSTSLPHGTQGNIITRGGPSLRRRPGYDPCPGDRCMDGDGGWGPRSTKKNVFKNVRNKQTVTKLSPETGYVQQTHIPPSSSEMNTWRCALTCPQHAVDGPLLSLGCWPADLARRAHVGRGGRGVWLRRELGKRVAARHQDLRGTHEADAVLAWQNHRLFEDVFAHGTVKLALQALHV